MPTDLTVCGGHDQWEEAARRKAQPYRAVWRAFATPQIPSIDRLMVGKDFSNRPQGLFGLPVAGEIGDSSFMPADAHPQPQSVNLLLEALTTWSRPRFINSIPDTARAPPLKSDTVRASPNHKLENNIPNTGTSEM